jgi:hypothetical protein
MIDQIIKDLNIEINRSKIIDIQFLSLLGSYREDEAVSGYSDCDLLFILKSDEYGNISCKTIELLKVISRKLSTKYSVIFSFLTHTEFDLCEYVDIEYLQHYSWGRVLIGSKNQYKKLFDRILSQKDTTDIARKSLMYYNIIHARFNILRKYVSLNRYNSKNAERQISILFVDKLIEIIDWILIYDNNYFETKKEIIKQFAIRNRGVSKETLNDILLLRNKLGGNVKISELKKFNCSAVKLLKQLTELIIKKHKL